MNLSLPLEPIMGQNTYIYIYICLISYNLNSLKVEPLILNLKLNTSLA
jgi:hypothetical protein